MTDQIHTFECPFCGTLIKGRFIPEPERTLSARQNIKKPVVPSQKVHTTPPTLETERTPFDEWLLSVRNIKVALYSGAFLLVLAGIVFIASRWGELGGPAKFAAILLATGLLYLGGYLLYRRHDLQLGGVAVLGVSSGFLPLNFAVLQIHVLGPGGFRDDVMWLIASPACLLLYALTAYWTRAGLFTTMGIGALASTLTAGLVVAGAPVLAFPLAYLSLALSLLWLAWRLQNTQLAEFTRTPLLATTHLAVPFFILAALLGSMLGDDPWLALGSPGLALAGMFVGVSFYVATDALFGWWAGRCAWAGLFPLALCLTLAHLGFDDLALGVAFMLLALAYLGAGHGLQRLRGQRMAGWPLYAIAYILAAWVTFEAMDSTSVLTLALLGDVLIFVLSGAIFRDIAWIYGAVWLLMLPIYLFLSQNVPALHHRGLLMGLLGLNYLGAGYALSRREVSAGEHPRQGGPFLTAAAFLSVLVVMFVLGNPVVATLLLAGIAVLYLGVALWLGQWPLIFPTLVALNLAVFTTQEIFLGQGVINIRALNIAYATLALALLAGGLWLRRQGYGHWAIPLYVMGACNMLGTFGLALLDVPLAIALSVVYALLLLAFAWWERAALKTLGLEGFSLLTFLGLALIVVGHFYVLYATQLLRHWPSLTAGLAGLFVLLAWSFRRGALQIVYGMPLRWSGLGLTLLAMAGALATLRPLVIATTFGIVGLTYAADAAKHRTLYLAYLAGAVFQVVYWALLSHLGVIEPQTYVIPLGLGLLALGWIERRRAADLGFCLPTLLGLLTLFIPSFLQSLSRDASLYAAWLLIESLVAITWGVSTRKRSYVSLGTLALVANGIAQLGPSFVQIHRWVQLAVIGSTLLGSGIAFLLKREELLTTRRAFTEEWMRWQP